MYQPLTYWKTSRSSPFLIVSFLVDFLNTSVLLNLFRIAFSTFGFHFQFHSYHYLHLPIEPKHISVSYASFLTRGQRGKDYCDKILNK